MELQGESLVEKALAVPAQNLRPELDPPHREAIPALGEVKSLSRAGSSSWCSMTLAIFYFKYFKFKI